MILRIIPLKIRRRLVCIKYYDIFEYRTLFGGKFGCLIDTIF